MELNNDENVDKETTPDAEFDQRATPDVDADIIRDYFDEDYYLACNEDVRKSGIDPLTHFCKFGWFELRDPNADFSTRYYLNANPDIQNANVNPLVHFVTYGKKEGRRGKLPDASTDSEAEHEERIAEEIRDIAAHFDATFYLETYGDVAESGMDPIEHFTRYGWRTGCDPSAQFSTQFYLSTYPDVAASGINPFWHYIVAGRSEGRLGKSPVDEGETRSKTGSLSPEAEVLAPHFDTEFYLEQCPDLRRTEEHPIEHYLDSGWRDGLDPHPEFSTASYLEDNPDVAGAAVNPYWHYLAFGKKEERVVRASVKQADAEGKADVIEPNIEDIRPYFDAEFYAARNPDIVGAVLDTLEQYWTAGWKEGRDPNPDFSTQYYLDSNPDVERLGINPFWHYIVAGRAEGRLGKPPVVEGETRSKTGSLSPEAEVLAPHFDTEFYLEQCPDLRRTEEHPIEHYLDSGWRDGLDPHPEFSTAKYLEDNPDVAKIAINPYFHYLVEGKKEGRVIRASVKQTGVESEPAIIETTIEDIRHYFDTEFYTARNPDIIAAAVDPLEHYWTAGWKEGRDPNPDFSTRFYLDSNPDVESLGINPFWHYIVAGRAEGRLGQHPGGYRVDRLLKTVPLEEEVNRWRSSRTPAKMLNTRDLRDRLARTHHPDRRGLILSVGHDNYRKISGGVQLCEHREETLSASTGHVYLYVYPWQALPRLAHESEDGDPIVGLLLEGKEIGHCRISDLIRAIGAVAQDYNDVHVVIHHLLGHLPERLSDLVLATGNNQCWLWAHDFFTICPSFTLQRNGITYCDAPPVTSNACRLCRFGKERQDHVERMRAFFEKVQVHILSPSQVTAETWQARSNLTAASLTVQPHMTLKWRKRSVPLASQDDVITLAFLGTPAPHKGWPNFERLCRSLHKTGGFRFLFLGSADVTAAGVEHERVHVTAEDPDAMIDAVARNNVDLVLHWASWPETFSLSTYEAYAGGAYVITNEISGNVAATVRTLGRGAVLRDEDDLLAFFADGRVDATVGALRAERQCSEVTHHLSRMVHDAIDVGAVAEEAR